MTSKVILLGTVANNHWREEVIQKLKERGIRESQIYNPVGQHWTKEMQDQEDQIKQDHEYLLAFVLACADPLMQNQYYTAAYSLTEAIMCTYDKRDRLVIFFDYAGFDKRTIKGLQKIHDDLVDRHHDLKIAYSYDQLVDEIIWRIYR